MEDGVTNKHYYHHHEKQQDCKQQRYNAGRNSHQAWQQKNGHLIQQRAREFDAHDYDSIGDPYLLGQLDNIIGHFRNDFQGEDSRKREGPLFGKYGSFLPVTLRPSPTDVNKLVSTQNCRVHESVTVGAVEKASRLKTAALPGIDSSFSGINSSTQNIRTHSLASFKDNLDKRQMTSTEMEDHLELSPKSTIQFMVSFNTCPVSPMPERHANLFSEKNLLSMGVSSNSIDFEQEKDIQVLIPKKKLTSLISKSKNKSHVELQDGTMKKLKKAADTNRITCKESGLVTENCKKIYINEGQGQVKGFVSNEKKMNKPFKKVMKSGLLDNDRNEAYKKEHLGQTVAKKKVVIDTNHGMEKGIDNVKEHNTFKKALKEKTSIVTRNKFEKSGKETKPKNVFLRSTVNNERTKTNTKEFHVSGVKRKFEQVDIKKESNILNSSFNIKKARQFEKEKKRDVTEDACTTTSNAYVSNVVDSQSLVELRTKEPSVAEPVPLVTMDNWVECDGCEKWRLLPLGVNPSSLIEKWFCSMQNWLPPEMRNCEISQKETEMTFLKLYGVSQSHVQTDRTWENVELSAPIVFKHLPAIKSANQVLKEDILQPLSKIGPFKKGVVQRSKPCVSIKDKLSCSLVKNGDQYPLKINKQNKVFSQCENKRRVNGAIKKKIPVIGKAKPKQISRGQGFAKTLKVKHKRDEEFKGYNTLNKSGVGENLVQGAKVVDLLPLKPVRTDGLKDSTYIKLAKENEQCFVPLSASLRKMPKDTCTQSIKCELNDGSLADDNKFRDRHQAIKKRKLKECKQSNSIQHGLLETECLEGFEPSREERQVDMLRKKNLKAKNIEAFKEAKVRTSQKVSSVVTNSELVIDEVENQCTQKTGEHDVMQNASCQTEVLKGDSSCLAPFVSTISSCSKLSCYTKILGSVPDVGGSSTESSVSSLTARDLATEGWGKEHWLDSEKVTFQQGRDLEEKADQIKNKGGAESDFIDLYFYASLKFLRCASIIEHSAADSARNRVNESLALYQYSARLSEECAKTYEDNEKWAAATLAYCCGGSAHMCIVKAKTATITRDTQELQSAVRLISSGESPCSSVSDVDNLNNQSLIHGNCSVNPDKGVGSLHVSRNYLIDQQHFPHYNQLLLYVRNTAIGMENFSKAQVAFHAFKRSSCEEREIDAVRRAIDFSFYNIDGLLHLVHLVMDAIGH